MSSFNASVGVRHARVVLVDTDAAVSLSVERSPLSGLEPGERALRELADRVHLG